MNPICVNADETYSQKNVMRSILNQGLRQTLIENKSQSQ
jgi:hypothetical protein